MKYKLKGYNHDKNKYIKENKIISNVDIGIFEKITRK